MVKNWINFDYVGAWLYVLIERRNKGILQHIIFMIFRVISWVWVNFQRGQLCEMDYMEGTLDKALVSAQLVTETKCWHILQFQRKFP